MQIVRDTKIMTNRENTIRIIEKMRKSQKLPLVIMLYLAVVVNAAEKLLSFIFTNSFLGVVNLVINWKSFAGTPP